MNIKYTCTECPRALGGWIVHRVDTPSDEVMHSKSLVDALIVVEAMNTLTAEEHCAVVARAVRGARASWSREDIDDAA